MEPLSRLRSSVDHRGPEHTETWSKLGNLLSQTWPHAHGAQLGLAKLAIDTGYESPAVYAWSRRMGHAQVAPIKGVEGFNRAAPVIGPTHVDVTEGGKKLRRGARLWTIAVATFKSETYRYLRLSAPTDEEIAAGAKHPAGYVHMPNGTEAEWLSDAASGRSSAASRQDWRTGVSGASSQAERISTR